MDEDCELLDERTIIVDIGREGYSADQLVRRAKIEMAEDDLDSSVAVVYKRVNTPIPSNIALENGHLVPLKGRYSNVLIEKGGIYEVRLVEKREETPELDDIVLEECYSLTIGDKAAEAKENIRNNQSNFPKVQAGPSKAITMVKSSILSDQQSPETTVMKAIPSSFLPKSSQLSSSSLKIDKVAPINCLKVSQTSYDCSSSPEKQVIRNNISRHTIYESNKKNKTTGQLGSSEKDQEYMDSQRIQKQSPETNDKLSFAKVIEGKEEEMEDNKIPRARIEKQLKKASKQVHVNADLENTNVQVRVFGDFVVEKDKEAEDQENENVIPINIEKVNQKSELKKHTETEDKNMESEESSPGSSKFSEQTSPTPSLEEQIIIPPESLEMIQNMMFTVFNGKVHLIPRILKIDGGRAIYNAFRENKEDKEMKQGLTRLLGQILMEDCSNPGNPSPEEKREVVNGFCKLTKRPDIEKQLSNTKNAGSLDNWVRRVRSKKTKKERLEKETNDSAPDAKKPKNDLTSEDSQPKPSTAPVGIRQVIPVVSIPQELSPSPILFSSNNEQDWENGAAFRL